MALIAREKKTDGKAVPASPEGNIKVNSDEPISFPRIELPT